MVRYVLPLASLLLTFLATMACLRFLFSRQGLFWIVPLVLSLLLDVNNLIPLVSPAGVAVFSSRMTEFFLLALSFFWYLMVITFHSALKRKVDRNRFRSDMIKNYTEARFLEKNERRAFSKRSRRRRRQAGNSYVTPDESSFHGYDLDAFDC